MHVSERNLRRKSPSFQFLMLAAEGKFLGFDMREKRKKERKKERKRNRWTEEEFSSPPPLSPSDVAQDEDEEEEGQIPGDFWAFPMANEPTRTDPPTDPPTDHSFFLPSSFLRSFPIFKETSNFLICDFAPPQTTSNLKAGERRRNFLTLTFYIREPEKKEERRWISQREWEKRERERKKRSCSRN